jgi:hypothetical protein
MTRTAGTATFAQVAGNTLMTMFRHDPDAPSSTGVAIAAQLGIDNIAARSSASLYPSQFTTEQGIYRSGTLQSLYESDNDRLVIEIDPNFDTANPIQFSSISTSPLANPSSLDFEFEGSADATGRQFTISFFDYTLGLFVPVRSVQLATFDTTTTVSITTNPSRFVNQTTKQVRCRLNLHEGFADFGTLMTLRSDKVRWRVTP